MDDSLCPKCGYPPETGGGYTRNGCILYYLALTESPEQYRRGERREMREEARDAFWEGVGEGIARFVSRIVD